jgi:hypothetical protein
VSRPACSAQSRGIDEDIRGTVPVHSGYLFLPAPAPWPHQAGSAPASVPGLGPIPAGTTTVLYRSYPDEGDSASLAPLLWNVHDRRIRQGATRAADDRASAGATPTPVTRFLGVCIHGRHDPCCGRAGAPLLRRLHDLLPDAPTFGVSHIGGDRLAANAIMLPGGYLLGRLDHATDEQLTELVLDGLLPLGHIRGRLGSTPAESVAEIWFRERYRLRRPEDLPRVTMIRAHDNRHTVAVEHAGRRHLLHLHRDTHQGGEIHFTCSAAVTSAGRQWKVIPHA